jgi:hypothetical protein
VEVAEPTQHEPLFRTLRGGGIEYYPYRSPNRESSAEPAEPPEHLADSGATVPAPQRFAELKVEPSSQPATPIVWVEMARAAIAKLEPDEQMDLFRDLFADWQDKAKIEQLRAVLMARLVEIDAAEVEAAASKPGKPAAVLQRDDNEGRTAP